MKFGLSARDEGGSGKSENQKENCNLYIVSCVERE